MGETVQEPTFQPKKWVIVFLFALVYTIVTICIGSEINEEYKKDISNVLILNYRSRVDLDSIIRWKPRDKLRVLDSSKTYIHTNLSRSSPKIVPRDKFHKRGVILSKRQRKYVENKYVENKNGLKNDEQQNLDFDSCQSYPPNFVPYNHDNPYYAMDLTCGERNDPREESDTETKDLFSPSPASPLSFASSRSNVLSVRHRNEILNLYSPNITLYFPTMSKIRDSTPSSSKIEQDEEEEEEEDQLWQLFSKMSLISYCFNQSVAHLDPLLSTTNPSFSERKPSFSERKPSFSERKTSFSERKTSKSPNQKETESKSANSIPTEAHRSPDSNPTIDVIYEFIQASICYQTCSVHNEQKYERIDRSFIRDWLFRRENEGLNDSSNDTRSSSSSNLINDQVQTVLDLLSQSQESSNNFPWKYRINENFSSKPSWMYNCDLKYEILKRGVVLMTFDTIWEYLINYESGVYSLDNLPLEEWERVDVPILLVGWGVENEEDEYFVGYLPYGPDWGIRGGYIKIRDTELNIWDSYKGVSPDHMYFLTMDVYK